MTGPHTETRVSVAGELDEETCGELAVLGPAVILTCTMEHARIFGALLYQPLTIEVSEDGRTVTMTAPPSEPEPSSPTRKLGET